MKWNSVRVRLTLWNVFILAFVLAGFGLTLLYTVRGSLDASLDQDLGDRGRRSAALLSGSDAPRFAPRTGGASRLSSDSSEADRRGFFRRPRALNMEGYAYLPGWEDEPWDWDTFRVSAIAGKEQFSTISFDGEPVRVFSVPLLRDGEVEGVVQVAHPLQEKHRLERDLNRTLLTLIPVALLVAGAGGAFMTERAMRPVRDITQAAAQIGAQDLSRRLKVAGKDEFAELAKTFNGMIARLAEAFGKLDTAYQQQRRFVGDASHELRTPLTTIKANTSLALSGPLSPADYRESMEAVDHAADVMTRIVQDLLLLARSDGGQLGLYLQPTSLHKVLEQAASAARSGDGAPIRLDLPPDPVTVLGDAHHLTRLFGNLLENARRHTPADGRITILVEEGGRDTRAPVTVRVRDTGEGIPPEHLPHVFERFYRVDAARARAQGGTGLGLPICQSIVTAHGGAISVESEVGRGTTVTVTLPRAEAPAAADEAPAALAQR